MTTTHKIGSKHETRKFNKTCFALAALAFSGVASAQSNITVFGVLDAAVSHYDARSVFYSNDSLARPPAAAPADVTKSKWAMSTGNMVGSRLGFRGIEDLGGGQSASFWLEAGLTNDTGQGTAPGGGLTFNRRSTVSLASAWGEIRLGRDYVPTYQSTLVADPFGNGGVGGTLFGTVGANLAVARGPGSPISSSDNYARTSNSVGYFLPSNLGGFYGQLMYALPETTKVSGTASSPSSKGRYYGGRFGYASGPWNVVLAYGSSQAADGADGNAWVRDRIVETSLVTTYDFGPLQLLGELVQMQARREVDSLPAAAASTWSHDTYNGGQIGVILPIGAGVIRATYAELNFYVDGDRGSVNTDASAQKLALGYVYNLSKRTALYATVGKVLIKNGQNNPNVLGATTGGGLTYLSTGAGVQGYAPRSSTGYDFGIKHSF
ncbi:porin [Variovorax saccharolyticus]|uniref:porin n=1 Tax=Variovorax saccharolyticus TaxID=3053516 RepID=UPI002579238E|nr:porin [Variovorax sp. J22R187]MDM0021785.1 porin [Variovorax sp. J22R187]